LGHERFLVLNRRHFIATAAWALPVGASFAQGTKAAAAVASTSPAAKSSEGKVVLVLGDSLSAEYGLSRGTGWVALLDKKLAEEKIAARVVNASISGDTTSGGRSRLPALVAQHQPAVVVIELGGNDALRGLPLELTADNLTAMTQARTEGRREGAAGRHAGTAQLWGGLRDAVSPELLWTWRRRTRPPSCRSCSRAWPTGRTRPGCSRPTEFIRRRKHTPSFWPTSGPELRKLLK
jgi:hypothetical protein